MRSVEKRASAASRKFGVTVHLPDEVMLLVFDALEDQPRRLHFRDLYACALVCKDWYPRAIQYIYRTLYLVKPMRERSLNQLSAVLCLNKVAAASVGKLVYASVNLASRPWMLQLIFNKCINLQEVSTELARDTMPKDMASLASYHGRTHLVRLALYGASSVAVKSFLAKLPALRWLSLENTDFTDVVSADLDSALPALQEAHFVQCTWPTELDGYTKQLLLEMGPSVMTLRFDATIPPIPAQMAFSVLSSLVLERLHLESIAEVLKATPNVIKLVLDGQRLSLGEGPRLSTLLPCLRILTLRCMQLETAREIAASCLGDSCWLPRLIQLPRITLWGDTDAKQTYAVKLAGLSNWKDRRGKQASLAEKANFMIRESYMDVGYSWTSWGLTSSRIGV